MNFDLEWDGRGADDDRLSRIFHMNDAPIFKPVRLTNRGALVWLLHRRGIKKAEIARRLGISSQTVSKSWKKAVPAIQQLGGVIKMTRGNPNIIESYVERELRRTRLAKFLERRSQHDPMDNLITQVFGSPDGSVSPRRR